MGGAHTTRGKDEKHKILLQKSEGKWPFWIPLHRLEDNIKMGLKEIGYEEFSLIHLAQDKVQW